MKPVDRLIIAFLTVTGECFPLPHPTFLFSTGSTRSVDLPRNPVDIGGYGRSSRATRDGARDGAVGDGLILAQLTQEVDGFAAE